MTQLLLLISVSIQYYHDRYYNYYSRYNYTYYFMCKAVTAQAPRLSIINILQTIRTICASACLRDGIVNCTFFVRLPAENTNDIELINAM